MTEATLAQPAPRTFTEGRTLSYVPALDGLRGVAILLVLVCHGALNAVPVGHFDQKLLTTLRAGWVGVDLFFVLSGYLITGILLKEKGSSQYLRNFYIRRFLRIFPMYYAFLFVMFVVVPAIRPLHSPAMIAASHNQIWLWTYSGNLARLVGQHPALDGFGHFWSLAVEEHFYLIWPFVILLSTSRVVTFVSAGCFAGSFLLRSILWAQGVDTEFIYGFTLCRLDGLVLGALIAIAVRDRVWRNRLKSLAKPVGASALALLAIIFSLYGSWWSDAPVILFGYSLLAIAFGSCLILVVDLKTGVVARLLNGRFLRSFGKHSYSLYIIHYPLQPIVLNWVYFSRLQTASSNAIAVDYGLSLITWHLWEKYFISLKDRFTSTHAVPPQEALT